MKYSFTKKEVEYIYTALDEYDIKEDNLSDLEIRVRKELIRRVSSEFCKPYTDREIELNKTQLTILIQASSEYSNNNSEIQRKICDYFEMGE